MDRQAAAHEDEQVREAENEQRCNRRSVPEYREQDQSVDTERRAAAREDEQVREAENEQRRNGQLEFNWFLNIGNRNNLPTQKEE
jgi:hypothetical protein